MVRSLPGPGRARIRALLPTAFALCLLCSGSLGCLGCRGREGSVTLAGSTAFQPFAEKLADEYDVAHPEINVTVQGGGSALGISAALNGAAQIGMADLVDLPADAAALKSVIVARDGIAVVVNPKNKVSDIPMAKIRDVYVGSIRNWRELGGEDAPITVVSRESGSGTRSSFESILGHFDLRTDAIIQDSNGTIRETVANDDHAIGYLSYGLVNAKIKSIKVDGQVCTTQAILAGTYPLVRPIYFLTLGEPQGAVRSFMDFVLGPAGQASIVADGLLPLASPSPSAKPRGADQAKEAE
jgi:phosphate transport system substrate-binding protein